MSNALEDKKQKAIRDVADDEIKRLTAEEPPEPGHGWHVFAVDDPISDKPTLRFAIRPVRP